MTLEVSEAKKKKKKKQKKLIIHKRKLHLVRATELQILHKRAMVKRVI